MAELLIDSHCHLDFPEFSDDFEGVLLRAQEAGVGCCITISTHLSRFPQVLSLAEKHSNIYCSVGIHPHQAATEELVTPDMLIELAKHPKVVAIGETGLDYHYDFATPDRQKEQFLSHIQASRQSGLPLVIHARDADQDMIDILQQQHKIGPFPFVLHCFSSGVWLARAGLSLGGYISLSGIITFKNSKILQDIAADIPLDRLLVETDAPYLAPQPVRGKRNEPAFVIHTAKKVAEIKSISFEDICKATARNTTTLFRKIVV